MNSLDVQQVRKAMWGWCLNEDKRRAILTHHPLAVNIEINDCKPGILAFNRMKEIFGRYVRRIPAVYNKHREEVVLV